MKLHILDAVRKFFESISDEDSAKIAAHLKLLQDDHTEGLTIKLLKGKIKEIVVRQYRVIFFVIGGAGYAVAAFRKQGRKTPKRIIEQAERIFKDISR
jgi:phage-related protein